MDDEHNFASSSSSQLNNDVDVAKLLRFGHEALEKCEEKIQTWKAHQVQYENLKEYLEKLPQELSYDVMVPFGSCAMMSGKMIHTNEILVLLGDNWFVSRTAIQAVEIVIRRLDYVEKELKKLQEEKEFYVSKVKLMGKYEQNENEGDGDVVEIREEYLEDNKPCSTATLATVQGEDEPISKNNEEIVPQSSKVSVDDYNKLMSRLDELEKFEELEDERMLKEEPLDSVENSVEKEENNCAIEEELQSFGGKYFENVSTIINERKFSPPSIDVTETVKRVVDEVVNLVENKNEEETSQNKTVVKKVTWDENSLEKLDDKLDEASSVLSPIVESAPSLPATTVDDIACHLMPPMKSILKNRRESSPVDYNLVREMEERRAITTAFTGVVCEKPMKTHADDVNKKPPAAVSQEKANQRRVSKFKVQRASIQ